MRPEPEEKEYATIENTTEEECYERWQGVAWEPNNEESNLGTCKSDYDFDSWAEEYEGGKK